MRCPPVLGRQPRWPALAGLVRQVCSSAILKLLHEEILLSQYVILAKINPQHPGSGIMYSRVSENE